MILSAGGHDEQPCDVNSSTTARGSAWAGRMTATTAQTPSAPDQREIELWAIIVVMLGTGCIASSPLTIRICTGKSGP
jgi:hypothetical protein